MLLDHSLMVRLLRTDQGPVKPISADVCRRKVADGGAHALQQAAVGLAVPAQESRVIARRRIVLLHICAHDTKSYVLTLHGQWFDLAHMHACIIAGSPRGMSREDLEILKVWAVIRSALEQPSVRDRVVWLPALAQCQIMHSGTRREAGLQGLAFIQRACMLS